MKNKILIAFLGALIIALVVIALNYNRPEPLGQMDTPIVRYGVLNRSTTTIGTSPTLLSATTTGRFGFVACHNSATTTDKAYIHFSSATSSSQASTSLATSILAGEGYTLDSGECFSMIRDTGFLYTGSIFVVASSSTSTFSIMER